MAVGVSGGPDSMALALLTAQWVHAQNGTLTALTVDHRLRPESTAEAQHVGTILAAHGIPHRILPWEGEKPAADIQGQARHARYGLLEAWCREHHVLHLLLAHHQDDQAETLLLRLGRGSGVEGLAAMPALHEGPWVRLLRPLLTVPREQLEATVLALGGGVLRDPSNLNPRFSRVRLRQRMPLLAQEGLTPERLAATAAHLSRARAATESAVARAAAQSVTVHPAGFALVEREIFAHLPQDWGLRLLSRLLMAVGGGHYAPRFEQTERFYHALRTGSPADWTLGGCRLASHQGRLLFCREQAAMAPRLRLSPGGETVWDERFLVRVAPDAPEGLWFGSLAGGWRLIVKTLPRETRNLIPALTRPLLPTLYHEDSILAVPHLGYKGGSIEKPSGVSVVALSLNPLTTAERCLV